ncbi:MAG TPA: hypothetical protein VE957_23270 [Terriglobales bacterium]|nr:hypothetical protein [Terriglobales bacterium]
MDRQPTFVQFVSTGSNHTAQMKVLIEHHHGLPLRALVSRFFLHHADLNLLGNETTD